MKVQTDMRSSRRKAVFGVMKDHAARATVSGGRQEGEGEVEREKEGGRGEVTFTRKTAKVMGLKKRALQEGKDQAHNHTLPLSTRMLRSKHTTRYARFS